jgi:hypothetical protein
MSKKMPSKDEALEALDFIVNVLKEHEKDLDRLINELGNVTEQLGQTGELTGKVEKIEHKINGLQNEIGGLINYLSTSPKEPFAAPKEPQRNDTAPAPGIMPPIQTMTQIATNMSANQGPAVMLRCKQWEDFQSMAVQAQTISFLIKEPEKTFQADAVKNNQIITYTGEMPKPAMLLKIWLAKQLDVPEKRILEGVLAIS